MIDISRNSKITGTQNLTSSREFTFPTIKKPEEFEKVLELGAVPGAISESDLLLLSDALELDPGIAVPVVELDAEPDPDPDPDTFPREVLTKSERCSAVRKLFRINISTGKISFFLHVDERDTVTAKGAGEILTRGTENTIPHTRVVEVFLSMVRGLHSAGPAVGPD